MRCVVTEHDLPGVDRTLEALGIVLRETRDLERQLDAFGFVCGATLCVGEHREQLRAVFLGRVLPAIEVEHHGLARVGATHAREIGLGPLGTAQHAPLHHRDLEQDALFGVGLELTRAQRVFVDGDQVVPHLALGEVGDEEAERLLVRWSQLEHALVALGRTRPVVEVLCKHTRCGEQQAELIVATGHLLGRGVEHLAELLPLLSRTQGDLEQPRRAGARGIGLPGSPEEPVDFLVLALFLVLPEDRCCAHEQ